MVDGTVGLYHKRLSIIDLTTGQQPMTRRRLTVAFNGEIYNYVELRDELKRRGHAVPDDVRHRSHAAHVRASTAPTAFAALNGMFAFVLYDRDRRRAACRARSLRHQAAVLPCRRPARGSFASEIKALLRHSGRRAGADPMPLRDYLTFQFVLGDATLFARHPQAAARVIS